METIYLSGKKTGEEDSVASYVGLATVGDNLLIWERTGEEGSVAIYVG